MGGGGCGKTLFMIFGDFSSEGKSGRHFLLIGGFLGAGKTTLIQQITKELEKSGRRVALITNDQGEGLMDTVSARRASTGTGNVAEITGGCFCCRLDELVETIARLEEETLPEILIAEPVGSCTDLIATVLQPLEKIYHSPLVLAPLSVVLDARRALAALGGRKNRRSFHRDVGYVFQKQLEEAEWLVVNKIDLLDEVDLEDLKRRLEKDLPGKKRYFVSAKTGEGVGAWLEDLLGSESRPGEMMEMDYERYAAGEAMLGWVNLEGSVMMKEGDPGEWLRSLGKEIAGMLDEKGHEVGHFKMSLDDEERRWRVHQVMGGEEIELVVEGFGAGVVEIYAGQRPVLHLLVNLRAEGDAGILQQCVHAAFEEQSGAEVTLEKEAAFQPGKPVPTHRIA